MKENRVAGRRVGRELMQTVWAGGPSDEVLFEQRTDGSLALMMKLTDLKKAFIYLCVAFLSWSVRCFYCLPRGGLMS